VLYLTTITPDTKVLLIPRRFQKYFGDQWNVPLSLLKVSNFACINPADK